MLAVLAAALLMILGGAAVAEDDPRCPANGADAWVETGVIRIGYRPDAPPFSFRKTAPAAEGPDDPWRCVGGYSIELCRQVVRTIREELDAACAKQPVKAELVPVALVPPPTGAAPAGNGADGCGALPPQVERFAALDPETPRDRGIDMLCGATSMTVDRMFELDYSLITYITGAAFLYARDTPFAKVGDLVAPPGEPPDARPVGVLQGGSGEHVLGRLISDTGLDRARIRIKELADYGDVVPQLLSEGDDPRLFAFFGDKEILLALVARAAETDPDVTRRLVLSGSTFSYEPYALAFRRDNRLLRFYANTALVRLFGSSDALGALLRKSFPGRKVIGEKLRTLFEIQQIPEGRGRRAAPGG
jgi:polar amino acid transport system substrate-binding protein/glutamate/aspartate transport system substrate-binding protein